MLNVFASGPLLIDRVKRGKKKKDNHWDASCRRPVTQQAPRCRVSALPSRFGGMVQFYPEPYVLIESLRCDVSLIQISTAAGIQSGRCLL